MSSRKSEKGTKTELYVKTLSGKTLTLQVSLSESVLDLKKQIQNLVTGAPVNDQQLIFAGKELANDGATLSSVHIKHESVLHLIVIPGRTRVENKHAHKKGKNAIMFFIRIAATGKSVTLDCDLYDTIQDVKDSLYSIEGILPGDQKLMFKGKELKETSKTLFDYGINNEAILRLVEIDKNDKPVQKQSDSKTQIVLNLLQQSKNVTLDVSLSDSVQHLKEQIHKKEGIPVNDQQLAVEDKVLTQNKKTLSSYNIKNKSVLYLMIVPGFGDVNPDIQTQLFVKDIKGKTITLEVFPSDSVADIKNKIFEKEGIEPKFQQLTFEGTELKANTKTLQQYHIYKRATLLLKELQKQQKPTKSKKHRSNKQPIKTTNSKKKPVKTTSNKKAVIETSRVTTRSAAKKSYQKVT